MHSSHEIEKSADGSYTAFSSTYHEHYHSTKDGALTESLYKHIYPALNYSKDKSSLQILDICFGLGYNTLLTLLVAEKLAMDIPITIHAPERDKTLVESLIQFPYPPELEKYRAVIDTLATKQSFSEGNIVINVILGDAREFVEHTGQMFDIVYQDAFSPKVNEELWSFEYFKAVGNIVKEDAIVTTYSTAFLTRYNLYKNGFNIYLNRGEGFRNATIASKAHIEGFQAVDMEHKIACNGDLIPDY